MATITVSTVDGGHTATCDVTVTALPTSITLSQTSLVLTTDGTAQLSSTVLPENATNKAVTWASSAPWIAIVSNDGLVTGIAPGTVTITVSTVDGGLTATCAVTVTALPTSVTLSQTSLTLTAGGAAQLSSTVLPENATNKAVTWASSAPQIAAVSSDGLVTGIAAGTATITVSTVDGGLTATCDVAVTPNVISPTSITLSHTSIALAAGGVAQLLYTFLPANATNEAVVWASSDTQVAVVSGFGVVTAIAAGTTTITVHTEDGRLTATCFVTVTAEIIPATAVWLSQTSLTLAAGGAVGLSHVVLPGNATNKTVTWASSNTQVATVSNEGVVIGIAQGTATITVRTVDGGYTATCDVTVGSYSGILPEGNESYIYYYGDVLSVNTPMEEDIAVYSLTGSLIHIAHKATGEANFHIPNIPKGVFIVTGSSGWTKKAIKP
jgi:uncharacterized protein YjdB